MHAGVWICVCVCTCASVPPCSCNKAPPPAKDLTAKRKILLFPQSPYPSLLTIPLAKTREAMRDWSKTVSIAGLLSFLSGCLCGLIALST